MKKIKKILYIEDNISNFIFLKDLLKNEGYEVYLANNGLDGIKQAETIKPDLIILDINLPNLDGYEVCAKIKSHNIISYIPIIAISGDYNKKLVDKIKLLGAAEVLPKPINIEKLFNLIKKLLDKAEKKEKNFNIFEYLEKNLEKYINDVTKSIIENRDDEKFIIKTIKDIINNQVTINSLYNDALKKLEDAVTTIDEQKYFIKELLSKIDDMKTEFIVNPEYIDGNFSILEIFFILNFNFKRYIKNFDFDNLYYNKYIIEKIINIYQDESKDFSINDALFVYLNFLKKNDKYKNLEINLGDFDINIRTNPVFFRLFLNAIFNGILNHYNNIKIIANTKIDLYNNNVALILNIKEKVDMEKKLNNSTIKELDFIKELSNVTGYKFKYRYIDNSTEIKIIFPLKKNK